MCSFSSTSVCYLLVMILTVFIYAQDEENLTTEPVLIANLTDFQFSCSVNGKNYTGDECLESLNKFGKTIGWIIMIVLLIIFISCCGCWCCICKIIHGKKNRNGGQVIQQPNNPVITTVA